MFSQPAAASNAHYLLQQQKWPRLALTRVDVDATLFSWVSEHCSARGSKAVLQPSVTMEARTDRPHPLPRPQHITDDSERNNAVQSHRIGVQLKRIGKKRKRRPLIVSIARALCSGTISDASKGAMQQTSEEDLAAVESSRPVPPPETTARSTEAMATQSPECSAPLDHCVLDKVARTVMSCANSLPLSPPCGRRRKLSRKLRPDSPSSPQVCAVYW